MATKKEITGQFASRYKKAKKAEKAIILNEYVALVEDNREYAIFNLNRKGKKHPGSLRVSTLMLKSQAGNKTVEVFQAHLRGTAYPP